MRNSIQTELWKAIHNRMFLIALTIGILICMLDVLQNGEMVQRLSEKIIGSSGNKSFAGISLFTCWIPVNGHTFGNVLFYFIWPILAAMPFGWSYAQERRDGTYYQIVSRSGKKTYFIAKYIAVLVSGGLVIAIPVIWNLLISALICPAVVPKVIMSINSVFNGWFLSELYYTHPWAYAWIWCGMEFLWGGAAACICFIVGAKPRFQVITILTPFVTFVLLDGAYNILLGLTRWNLELSPLRMAQAATYSANPEWAVFSVLGVLFVCSFLVGYWQVVKHELA